MSDAGKRRRFQTRTVHPHRPALPEQASTSVPIFQSSTFRFETNEEFARAIRFDGPGLRVLAWLREPHARRVPIARWPTWRGRSRRSRSPRGWPGSRRCSSPSRAAVRDRGERRAVRRHLLAVAARPAALRDRATFVDPHGPRRGRATRCRAPPSSTSRRSRTPTSTVPTWRRSARCVGRRRARPWSTTRSRRRTCATRRPSGSTYVLHSATKYIGGHNDLIGGVVCTNEERLRSAPRDRDRHRRDDGPARGVALHARARDAASSGWSATAPTRARLAEVLEAHPKVERVALPGAGLAPAARGRGAACCRGIRRDRSRSRSPAASRRAALLRRARAGWVGRSLGGAHTLVGMPRPPPIDRSMPDARRARRDRRRPRARQHRAGGRRRSDRGLRPAPWRRCDQPQARVAVLFGGRSAEHEIVVPLGAIGDRRARSATHRGDPDRHHARRVAGIGSPGRRRCPPRPVACPRSPRRRQPPSSSPAESGSTELVGADGSRRADRRGVPRPARPVRARTAPCRACSSWPACRTWARACSESAIGMDKAVQKSLFAAAGLPVVPVRGRSRARLDEDPEAVEAARRRRSGTRCSPSRRRSGPRSASRRSHEPRELARRPRRGVPATRARRSWRRRPTAPARSKCAVLGNDDPVASVAGEIVPAGHEFYDYEAKYLDEHGAELVIPADLKPGVLEEVQRLAVAAFRGDRSAPGMARVDFFLIEEDELWS